MEVEIGYISYWTLYIRRVRHRNGSKSAPKVTSKLIKRIVLLKQTDPYAQVVHCPFESATPCFKVYTHEVDFRGFDWIPRIPLATGLFRGDLIHR